MKLTVAEIGSLLREMSKTTILKRAADIVGSQTAIADAVGVSRAAVSQVIRFGKQVPARWALPIERLTGGKITRYQIRPDVFGPAP